LKQLLDAVEATIGQRYKAEYAQSTALLDAYLKLIASKETTLQDSLDAYALSGHLDFPNLGNSAGLVVSNQQAALNHLESSNPVVARMLSKFVKCPVGSTQSGLNCVSSDATLAPRARSGFIESGVRYGYGPVTGSLDLQIGPNDLNTKACIHIGAIDSLPISYVEGGRQVDLDIDLRGGGFNVCTAKDHFTTEFKAGTAGLYTSLFQDETKDPYANRDNSGRYNNLESRMRQLILNRHPECNPKPVGGSSGTGEQSDNQKRGSGNSTRTFE
jgi:hypothetical protein